VKGRRWKNFETKVCGSYWKEIGLFAQANEQSFHPDLARIGNVSQVVFSVS
jgi:hypothetical protein